MAIRFRPAPGQVLGCDFQDPVKPEMQGWHLVVVVSIRLTKFGRSCTVVPITSIESKPVPAWHLSLPDGSYPFISRDSWAKTDLATRVGFRGLDVLASDLGGRGANITRGDLDKLRDCIKALAGKPANN